MDYELFHDKSQECGFWHGILLVPSDRKELFNSFIREIRKNTRYNSKISLKQVKRHGIIFDCANSLLQVGVGFLRSTPKGEKYHVFLGERHKGKINPVKFPNECVGMKFILFCERDNHRNMLFYEDHTSKIETTFRIGLKGGMHYLGSEESPINIVKMHFDGHEHYQRHLDKNRIINRLRNLRSYCSISDDCEIDDRSSDHVKDDCQEYTDCQLLQLTDLFVGGFRTYLGKSTRDIHYELGKPVSMMLKKYRQGYARMQNSRWKDSLWLSRCFIDGENWKFESLEYKNQSDMQLNLFN